MHLETLVHELGKCSNLLYGRNQDVVLSGFAYRFREHAADLKEILPRWQVLDQENIGRLYHGESDDWLPVEIVDQLAGLLLDELADGLSASEVESVCHIRDVCRQIRAVLNEAMGLPLETKLRSRLDQPETRIKLRSDFDTILRAPVHQMITSTEALLATADLNNEQREYLEIALKNSHQLARILQTAAPLIETQNFREMARLTHDYRTPFCGLNGYLRLVLKQGHEGLVPDQIQQLKTVLEHSGTVLGMANNLIDAVKLMTSSYTFMCDRTDVAECVQGIMGSLGRYQRAWPDISLQFRVDDHIPPVDMYEAELRHCMFELFDNAFKYTPDGSICLDVGCQGNEVCFTLQDTGIGIPPDEQERIFEPFTQVGDQPKGLGLGLYIANEFAKNHRGNLTVESQMGIGSTFTLKVPVSN